eukprot:CAMPEP_0174371234 /NCGR_PEP_ID=MMETSP0811_2-20130205/99025_1 /TAXON_ID=73025 ORGANISM="Eutreptiella gymnastica-like, Strain CCMP1594" /NCGR_SAMPLE_ID=MMETSP0811_2 /ASSEMBLY_ACC=CAM_ASM_000667 /LENGTH=56 /DNA_ID=CAMNT_0015517433 /DNA_START=537 /DNA_END=707 /DNA_ORIENTATION=+
MPCASAANSLCAPLWTACITSRRVWPGSADDWAQVDVDEPDYSTSLSTHFRLFAYH